MTSLDRLLADANPVPTPPPGRVTPAQEQLLGSIVAAPRRGHHPRAVRLVAVTSAIGAVVAAVVLAVGSGDVEREIQPGGPPTGAGDPQLIHVVTHLYGQLYGPGRGDRLDGWLESATGRARIAITADGRLTMEQVVQVDDRVLTWQAPRSLSGDPDGFSESRVDAGLAASLRASVRDRMAWLVESTAGEAKGATTARGEYRGRPVTIHRLPPPAGSACCYVKWFTDADTGTTVGYERGAIDKEGNDAVQLGERLVTTEELPPGEAPRDVLDSQRSKAPVGATPTPTPAQTP